MTIDESNYGEALKFVTDRDRDLRAVIETYGEPPIWIRPKGFPTLVHIILEQQVSLASARAAYEKLKQKIGENFSPANFLSLSDEELKTLGFSRQKTLYTRNLAMAIVNGNLNLIELENLTDQAVYFELTKLKGIGRWTSDIYLLMCLRRADVFPTGDLGLIVGVERIKNLPARPTAAELEEMGEHWRPFRSVATRIIWHFYLSEIRPYNNY